MGPMGLDGLALATSLAAASNLVILLVLLHRRLGRLDGPAILGSVWRTVLASAVMGGVCLWVGRAVPRALDTGRLWGQISLVVVAIGAGLVVYWGVARLLRIEELRVVTDALTGRRRADGTKAGEEKE